MPHRVLGQSQGFGALCIRDYVRLEDETPFMVSVWDPSPEERQLIAEGHPIRLSVMGRSHPPLLVEVGDESLQ
jgi:hypothetical protein